MEPLIFKPFKGEVKETFCREEIHAGKEMFFTQKAISASIGHFGELELRFAIETSRGSNGNMISLNPKQVIVLKDILAKIEIIENPDYHTVQDTAKASEAKQ